MKKSVYAVILLALLYAGSSFAIGTWPTPEFVDSWWCFFLFCN